MKKGLLLSVVASGILFAGGNIAPAAPVAPAAAPAACDFWGSLGARYEFYKDGAAGKANKWGKKDNTWKATVVLGVEKELGYGFGFGAVVAATSDLGLDIANPKYGEDAELSQLYLTYKTGNTAFKLGRQALPKTLSPWAWTDTTVGRDDADFEGLVVVNTDLPDTTLVGAWIARVANVGPVNGANNKGLFMLAGQYTGIANTTLRSSLYYVTKGAGKAKYSAWASAETKVSNVDLGLQVAFAKTKGTKSTVGVAAYAGTSFDAFDAKLTLAYINAGATTLNLGGTSAFWGNTFAAFGGDINGGKQKIARLDLGYKLPNNYGKIYGGVGYDKSTGVGRSFNKKLGAVLGYKFKVSGINAHIQYRYVKTTNTNGSTSKHQRVRVEGIYKF